jgi:hypothetical protein
LRRGSEPVKDTSANIAKVPFTLNLGAGKFRGRGFRGLFSARRRPVLWLSGFQPSIVDVKSIIMNFMLYNIYFLASLMK